MEQSRTNTKRKVKGDANYDLVHSFGQYSLRQATDWNSQEQTQKEHLKEVSITILFILMDSAL